MAKMVQGLLCTGPSAINLMEAGDLVHSLSMSEAPLGGFRRQKVARPMRVNQGVWRCGSDWPTSDKGQPR